MRRSSGWIGLLLAAACWPIGASRADDSAGAEPLHVRIDRLILAQAGDHRPAALADDAEFLRRISLDLAGRIPTADEVRAFLLDAAPDKRAQAVDRLLTGPRYGRRMQEAFHVMLMERNGDHAEWTAFLRNAFERNEPWDQIVREILHPNPDDPATRGSAFFWTKRLENYGQNAIDFPGLTRDVGRLFLGLDLQCAQCHDHLQVEDYKQLDFQGLFSFVGHTYIRTDLSFPVVGEQLVSKRTPFMSVFLKEPRETGPRLPGLAEVEIPAFAAGEEFEKPQVPKFSPLKLLSEQLPRPENASFVRNIVNRLWFLVMGRGLVHPLDLHHRLNPPSHPELLDLLAAEFAAHQCDIKWMLRELTLSETYQRASRLPDGVADLPPESFLAFNERSLSAEQLLWSALQATGEEARLQAAAPPAPPATAEAGKAVDQAAGQGAVPPEDPQLGVLRERFLKAFANPPREPEVEFAPSVRAALFLLNDSVFLGWLRPQPGAFTERLLQLSDSNSIAEELYLNILSRFPSDEERAEVAAYLSQRSDDRGKALGNLAWALFSSTEFSVNH